MLETTPWLMSRRKANFQQVGNWRFQQVGNGPVSHDRFPTSWKPRLGKLAVGKHIPNILGIHVSNKLETGLSHMEDFQHAGSHALAN